MTLTIWPMRVDEIIGPQLRALRWSIGLTADALAAALGISETRVRRVELQEHVRASTAARYLGALRDAHAHRAAEAFATAQLRPATDRIGHP